jgi:hypothetical protein
MSEHQLPSSSAPTEAAIPQALERLWQALPGRLVTMSQ